MSLPPFCLVALLLRPGETGPEKPVLDAALRAAGNCPQGRALVISQPGGDGVEAAALQRNAIIARARKAGTEWILFVEPGERLAGDVFHLLAPALGAYEAVFGGLLLAGGGKAAMAEKSLYSGSTFLDACHMLLNWWIGASHMVRTQTAAATGFRASAGKAWFADYILRLWEKHDSLKTAQGLTEAAELPVVGPDDRAHVIHELARHKRFISFTHGPHAIHLPYTGRNPTLERVQMRGLFYEQQDLEALQDELPAGAVIVDVGANTGNHTVFFAAIMGAARVIAIEPNPVAMDFLRETVQVNGLANVDLSKLGIGVGAASGMAHLDAGRRGFLGTATLSPASDGDIPVRRLDELVDRPVDLVKIDVESMEIDVLDGAGKLIDRSRPKIMIEVRDANIEAFCSALHRIDYRVKTIFADQGYANYLIVPAEGGFRP